MFTLRSRLTLLLLAAFSLAGTSRAGFGFAASDGAFIVINANGSDTTYRLTPSTGGEDPFHNQDFDIGQTEYFNYATNPLFITDFIAVTEEDGGPAVTGVTLFYRQYLLGETPGAFLSEDLFTSDTGLNKTWAWDRGPLNLTVPGLGNLGGRVVLELYVEATDGSTTSALPNPDGGTLFEARYTDFAIPEPAGLTLLGLGALLLRGLYLRRQKRIKAAALSPASPVD